MPTCCTIINSTWENQPRTIFLMAPAPAAPLPKIAKPDEFDGTSGQLEVFIHQCSTFLLLDNYTDQAKIMTVLSYMRKGSALAAN
jgi:hypothetical protein